MSLYSKLLYNNQTPLNGTTRPINRLTKLAAKPAHSPKGSTRKSSPRIEAGAKAALWATAYVMLAVVLSCCLNSFANVQHAPVGVTSTYLAASLGAVIPILVLILGRVSGLLYKRRLLPLSAVVGTVGVIVLGLSVVHCTDAIGLLTGSSPALACALAIGIDVGLVACEVASILAD